MKILVMGAGVIGVTTAYFLGRDGHEVEVIDRQPGPAKETTFANAGGVLPGHSYAWASPQVPLIMMKSLFRNDQAFRLKFSVDPRMWLWCLKFLGQCTTERARINTTRKLRLCSYSQQMLHAVVQHTNVHYDRQTNGYLYLYRSPETLEQGVAKAEVLTAGGREIEIVDRHRAAEIEPVLEPVKDKFAGGIYGPTDETGDAHLFSKALAEFCANELGVRFHFDTAIRGIDVAGDEVERVVTDKGDHRADLYILSLGSYSPIVARKIGISLPIYPVKGYSVTLPIGAQHTAPAVGTLDEAKLVAFTRLGERLRVTSTAEFSGYDTTHKPSDFAAMLRVAKDLFPNAADYSNGVYWAGLRPMTPEGTPIFGTGRYRNLFMNTGHGHVGWTMACGAGRITADLIAGRQPETDLAGMTLQ